MRNIRRDVVEARIDRHRDSEYEHKRRADYDPPASPVPARHLFLCGLHGAMHVALASLYVILGHHLLLRFHFLRGCRPCLTFAHGLNVSLQGVNGRLITFDVGPRGREPK